jgi:hypothetical protein
VYGVELNHKDKAEDFLVYVFSVSWANMANVVKRNTLTLVKICLLGRSESRKDVGWLYRDENM